MGKPVSPEKYSSLVLGEEYLVHTYRRVEKVTTTVERHGIIRRLSTKIRENLDKKGNVTSRERVGDVLVFEPTEPQATLSGETLCFVTVCCGLFQIFKVK